MKENEKGEESMKARKLFLATAAITLLMSATAFAGTWKNGSGADQGKWWYDNGDGTYAQNGWQWIDDNGDGIAECYYFGADGWMYADTATPDGYQVNASGAWVENGVVKTQAAVQTPVQTTGWFDAAGLQANALLNVPIPYVSETYSLPGYKTTGMITFYAYNTFDSSTAYPAQDGYEWKQAFVVVEFTDAAALSYGSRWAYSFGNRDKLELVNDWDGSSHTFSLNFNGKEYTDCKIEMHLENYVEEDGIFLDGMFTCCVPKGYTGMFVAFYDAALYNQVVANGEPAYIEALRNAVIFPLN